MSGDDEIARMISKAAVDADVPAPLLVELLALEEQFPDFSIQGAKTAFSQAVTEVLQRAATSEGTSA